MRVWQSILRHGGWQLLEKLGGRATQSVLADSLSMTGGVSEEGQAVRNQWLHDVLGRAVTEVPFYEGLRDLSLAGGLEDLNQFPVISKDELRSSAEAFVSRDCDGVPGRSVSGGSTGAPVTSFTDPLASDVVKAAMIEGRAWWGVHPWSRCLSVWGHSKYMGRGLGGRVKLGKRRVLDALANRRVIPAYDLSEAAVRRFNRAWHRDKPDYIIGYASALYEIARMHRELGLSVPGKECLVMSTGEVLHDWQADLIGEVMGCEVFEEYGLVEAGAVAYTARGREGLKVIQSHFVVEVLDAGDEPVGYGEEGRIVITCLRRKQVPVIRYDTGDRAVCLDESGGLDCKYISKVRGRTYDVIRKQDGTAVPGVVFTHAVKPLQQVDRFQIVQDRLGRVTVSYTSQVPLDDATMDAVRGKIQGEVGDDFLILFKRVPKLEAEKSGKYRWIRSEVN